MIAQGYPLFARWDGLTWRVIGWLDPDGVDLAWCPVVVAHGRTAVAARAIPDGAEFQLLVALNVSTGADNDNGENLWEWAVKYRRASWTDNHQCGNHYQTRKGVAQATTDLLRNIKSNPDPLDRMSILRRRVGPWERQPLADYVEAEDVARAPVGFHDPDPRYLRKHTDA